jgi:hypothetical protein
MVAKMVPGQLLDYSVILMRVLATVREDNVWTDAILEPFHPGFDHITLEGEVSVIEITNFYRPRPSSGKECLG